MSFAHPLALLLGLVAVPIVILYRRRVRLDRQPVATGMFWEQVFAQQRARSRWQRWRDRVSLAVQLLLVALGTLAAAGLQFRRPELLVLVIDNSASMNATDLAPSRLAAAKQFALRLIEGLGPNDQMAVLTAADPPAVVSSASGDAAALQAAVESIAPTSQPPQMAAALQVAEAFPMPGDASRRVVVLSDGCFAAAAAWQSLPSPFSGEGPGVRADLELIRFGTPAANTAITRWTARRSMADPRVCEVLVETRNFSPEWAKCQLSVAMDGKPVAAVAVLMPPNGRWQEVFSMTTAAGGRLTARLDPPDAYSADNEAAAVVPPAPTYRVTLQRKKATVPGTGYPVLSTQNDPLVRALLANPLVEMVDAKAAEEAKETGPSLSIHAYDGDMPETLPGGPVLVLGPTACDLWRLGKPIADATVARWAEDSPILADVQMVDVYLGGAQRLELTEAAKAAARPLLWTADGTPLGYAIDRPAGRVVVLCGSLPESNLPLQNAFPIFVANALDWLAGQKPADTVGGFMAGASQFCAGATGLDLRPPADLGVDPDAAVIRRPGPPAPFYPAVLFFAILAAEWCLYQRRWMS